MTDKMMGICLLYLLIGAVQTGSVHTEDTLTKGNAFANIAIEDRPGLYYEKVSPLRLQHADWRISVFIDVQKFIDGFPILEPKIYSALDSCQQINSREKCRELLRQEYINSRLTQARSTVQDLQKVAVASGPVQVQDNSLPRTIKKRSIPLGIIGSISKSLFGTMNQEDADYLNEQIDRLFMDQANLTHLIGQQTHITTSRLQQLHQDHIQEVKRINDLHMRMGELQRDVGTLDNETRRITYNSEVIRFTHLAEQKIEQYERTAEEYIRVITAARNGRYDAAILSIDQLTAISREIQTHAPEFEFPLSADSLRGESLARIVGTDLIYQQGRIIVAVHIPLLDRTSYQLHRIHSWPVPQNNNRTGSAYIIPVASYLVLSNDRRTYFLADSDYIGSCKKVEHKYLCPVEMPLHEVSTAEKCELIMLLNPSASAYRRCDIRVRQQHDPFWRHLPSQGGWLYSLSGPEVVHVLCPGLIDTTTTLNGAGVFHLSANCVGRTPTTALTGTRSYQGNNHYMYTPKISLEVALLVPVLQEQEIDPHQYPNEYQAKDASPWTLQEGGESLFEIEKKIQEIGTHRREKQHQQYLAFGAITIQIATISIIIGCCCWDRVKRGCDRFKQKPQTKQQQSGRRNSLGKSIRKKLGLRVLDENKLPEQELEVKSSRSADSNPAQLPRQVARIENY